MWLFKLAQLLLKSCSFMPSVIGPLQLYRYAPPTSPPSAGAGSYTGPLSSFVEIQRAHRCATV